MDPGSIIPAGMPLPELLGQKGRRDRQRRRAAAPDGVSDRVLSAGPFKRGVHTALDTAGQPFRPEDPEYLAAFDPLMASTSLVILDLKEIDPESHRQTHGQGQCQHPCHGKACLRLGRPALDPPCAGARPDRRRGGLRRTADFIASLNTVQRVEVLPYHTLGLFKWQKLGIPYPLPDARRPPRSR